MGVIRLLAWRNLSSHPLRALLAASGVVLGVALMMAVLTTGRSIGQERQRLVAGDAGSAALVITPAVGKQWMAETTAEQAASVSGVAAVVPQAVRASVFGFNGELMDLIVYAVAPAAEGQLNTYRMLEGEIPAAGNEPGIALEANWAAEADLQVGDRVELLISGNRRIALPVTGLIAREGIGRVGGGAVVLMNLAHYQQLTEHPGQVTRLLVVLERGANAGEVTEALRTELAGLGQVGATDGASSEAALDMGLVFFSGIATLVGAFLIFGISSLSERQRTTQNAMTLAVGATAGQVQAASLVEVLGIGLMGCIIGVPLGAGLSHFMIRMVGTSSLQRIEQLTLSPRDALAAAAVGMGVALLAGLVPAWRAGRRSPLEGIRQSGEMPARRGYSAALVGLVLGGTSLAGGIWAMGFNNLLLGQGFTAGYFLGVALAIPLLVRWGVRYLLEPIVRRLGPVSRMAAGNLTRNINRAVLTVSAMMVAVAMLISFSAVSASFWRGAEAYIESAMAGDLVLMGDLSPGVLADVRATPGVSAAAPEGQLGLRSTDGWSLYGRAIDPAQTRVVMPFHLDEGDREEALRALERGGAIILSTVEARERNIRLGDLVPFQARSANGDLVSDAVVHLKVVGLMTVNTNSGRMGYISLADAERHFGGAYIVVGYVKLAAGADAADTAAAIRQRVAGLTVKDFTAFKAELRADVDREMALFRVLLYIALGMSAFGIVNTLAMGVIEQRRELALLRAVGATGGQTVALVVVESLFLGLVGVSLGVLAGALFARGFVVAAQSFSRFVAPFAFPLRDTLLVAVLGLVLALVAGAWPAWRAGRITPVEGLRAE